MSVAIKSKFRKVSPTELSISYAPPVLHEHMMYDEKMSSCATFCARTQKSRMVRLQAGRDNIMRMTD